MKNLFLSFAGILFLANSSSAQIPNAGFESWTTVGNYENPNGWGTMNNKTNANSAYTATKGTPGSPGSSYLKLTATSAGGSVVRGVAVSGRLDSMTMKPISGYPFLLRPAQLTGKWQYMVFGNSIGSIDILLTKWNVASSMRDTVAYASQNLTGMAMSWANFSIPLTYQDSLNYPDSCMIVLSASKIPVANDYLWVDNLAFTGTVAVVEPPVDETGITKNNPDLINFNLSPNPAKGNFTLSYDVLGRQKFSVEITDINGKVVKTISSFSQQLLENKLMVNIEELSKGVYSVILKSGNASATRKLIVE